MNDRDRGPAPRPRRRHAAWRLRTRASARRCRTRRGCWSASGASGACCATVLSRPRRLVPRRDLAAVLRPARSLAAFGPARGLAGALAALLLALVVAPGERSVVDQAARARPRAADGALATGFPDWSGEFGWHERGARHDTLDGGVSTTVFYEHMGHRLAYTILAGRRRAPGRRAGRAPRRARDRALPRRRADVAVFERDGRTCVLAGHVLRTSTLVKLAAWKA